MFYLSDKLVPCLLDLFHHGMPPFNTHSLKPTGSRIKANLWSIKGALRVMFGSGRRATADLLLPSGSKNSQTQGGRFTATREKWSVCVFVGIKRGKAKYVS